MVVSVGRILYDLHADLRGLKAELENSAGDGSQTGVLRERLESAEKNLRSKAAEILAYQAQLEQQEEAKRKSSTFGRRPSRTTRTGVVPPLLSTPQEVAGGSSSSTARPRSRSSVHRGKTAASKRILPRINRKDPGAEPPELTERDLECGLYSLRNRGFLPASVDLTPGLQEVVKQKRSRMYAPHDRLAQKGATAVNLPTAMVKLDHTPVVPCPVKPPSRGNSRSAIAGQRSYINSHGECDVLVPLTDLLPRIPRSAPSPAPPIMSEEEKASLNHAIVLRSPSPDETRLFRDESIEAMARLQGKGGGPGAGAASSGGMDHDPGDFTFITGEEGMFSGSSSTGQQRAAPAASTSSSSHMSHDAVKKEVIASETEDRLVKEVFHIDRNSQDLLSKELFTVDKRKDRLLQREIFSIDKQANRIAKEIYYYVETSGGTTTDPADVAVWEELLSADLLQRLTASSAKEEERSLEMDEIHQPQPPPLVFPLVSNNLLVLKEAYTIERSSNTIIARETLAVDPWVRRVLWSSKKNVEDEKSHSFAEDDDAPSAEYSVSYFRTQVLGNFNPVEHPAAFSRLQIHASTSAAQLPRALENIPEDQTLDNKSPKPTGEQPKQRILYYENEQGGGVLGSAAADHPGERTSTSHAGPTAGSDGASAPSVLQSYLSVHASRSGQGGADLAADPHGIPHGRPPEGQNAPSSSSTALVPLDADAPRPNTSFGVAGEARKGRHRKHGTSSSSSRRDLLRQEQDDPLQHEAEDLARREILARYGLHHVPSREEIEGYVCIRYGNIFQNLADLKENQRNNWPQLLDVFTLLCRKLKKAPLAIIDVSKMIDVIFALGNRDRRNFSEAQIVGTCVKNLEELPFLEHEIPGLRFRGPLRRELAAECIWGGWQMFQCKLKMALLLKFHRAAKTIQVAWVSCQNLVETKKAINLVREEEVKRFTRLRSKFSSSAQAARTVRRLEIHLLSLSVPEFRRACIHSFPSVQNAQISRLFRLGYCGPKNDEPPPDVVLVCSKPLHEDLLEYMAKVMEYRGIQNPQGRLQILVPEKLDSPAIPAHMTLAHCLLLSRRAMNRLRVLIRGREERSVLIPGHGVTFAELQLSAQLNVPLYGANPKNVDYLGTKSAMQRLVTLAQVPHPPTSVDLYDEEELYHQFGVQLYEHPTVPKWIFKIDDEFRGKGSAIFHVDTNVRKSIAELQHRAMESFLHSATAEGKRTSDVTVDRVAGLYRVSSAGPVSTELRDLLIRMARDVVARAFPKKALLCGGGRMYPSELADFIPEFCKRGGIIQAVPGEVLSFPTVHFQVLPEKRTQLLATSEYIFSSNFEPVACLLPLQSPDQVPLPVCEAFAQSTGRVLAAKDMLGHASVDLVCFENKDFEPEERRPLDPGQTGEFLAPFKSPEPPGTPFDPEAAVQARKLLQEKTEDEFRENVVLPCTVAGMRNVCFPYRFWVVDVDVRITDAASAFAALQFIGQCQLGDDGRLYLAPHAPGYHKTDHAANERVALVVLTCEVPGLDRCTHSQIFSFCKARKVTYDLFQNTGVLFLQLDLVHETVSLLVIDRNRRLLMEKAQNAMQVLQAVTMQHAPGGTKQRAPLLTGEDRRGQDVVPHLRDVLAAFHSYRRKWGLLNA
ncbi:unnamed protein product [Amoebophrya sp. A120]|nr:unnamed protein product [Amoebophrya sp. A120]|eukprot:GSA120T00002535001.1